MNRAARTIRASMLGLALLAPSAAKAAGGLRGSPSSMETQHEVAVDEKLTFLARPDDVSEIVAEGGLVEVDGNSDYSLSGVSYPYARPEVKLFIERISAQHMKEIGSRLVVTSLTRPSALQPRNAHELSVHPAGMAVDFRVPADTRSRTWLEKALLGLENAHVLDVTRERFPPHYHVAVFPAEYLAYAEKRQSADDASAREERKAEEKASAPVATLVTTGAAPTVAAAPVDPPRDNSRGLMLTAVLGISGSLVFLARKPLGNRISR
jgi:hypothetical protein